MNNMYKRISSIDWNKEAIKISLKNDEMVELLKNTLATRKEASTKTKRAEFDELHYKVDVQGDYCRLYMYHDGNYYIYYNNMCDDFKNGKKLGRPDRLFEEKFAELNNITLRRAFGFVESNFKRCIPKQFSFVNEKYIGKEVIASSIDASSQYASGCLGTLPDVHGSLCFDHRVSPNEEYPFAFYASGHVAIYNELDTHEWLDSPFRSYLFRLSKDDPWPLRNLPEDMEETILMKASDYEMTDVWNYFYNNKQQYESGTDEYEKAKLIMNQTIGQWHRKDKDKKVAYSYDDNGSYKLAHIVAVAIARGNQKILNMVDKISPFIQYSILHICVDGIIYRGSDVYGQEKTEFGKFKQEFTGANFKMLATNVYCARKDGHCIKFKHAAYDLLDGKDIDETKDFTFEDLDKLGKKERVSDIIWEDQKDQETK